MNQALKAWLFACSVLAGLGSVGAQAGEIWRCQQRDGGVTFSDSPCPGSGAPIEPRRLQSNVADAPRRPAAAEPPAPELPPPGNQCPGDLELRNMETRANSTTLGEQERSFMQDEIRRVRQCRKGQGRYTDDDWALSREAQAAQSSSNAAKARLRAEGMHSAADPLEGERIARQRENAPIAERNLARMQRQPVVWPPALPCPPAPYSRISGSTSSASRASDSCQPR